MAQARRRKVTGKATTQQHFPPSISARSARSPVLLPLASAGLVTDDDLVVAARAARYALLALDPVVLLPPVAPGARAVEAAFLEVLTALALEQVADRCAGSVLRNLDCLPIRSCRAFFGDIWKSDRSS